VATKLISAAEAGPAGGAFESAVDVVVEALFGAGAGAGAVAPGAAGGAHGAGAHEPVAALVLWLWLCLCLWRWLWLWQQCLFDQSSFLLQRLLSQASQRRANRGEGYNIGSLVERQEPR
jgi:hypothetical protein